MATVKVWNDNVYPYREKFRGREIVIEPHSYVEMEYDQAVMFKGTMPSEIKLDKDGNLRPESYKKLRIDQTRGNVPMDEAFLNHATGKKFVSEDELNEDILAHSDKLLDEKEAKESIKKTTRRKASV